MARTNNLTNFLTDVAAAIKTKKGSSATIPAANFDTEILALPSQGVYQTRSVTISANGSQTVTPETGYDAIDEITINVQVPEAQLQTKTYNITQNANLELEPDSGYDGFSSVNVNVNVPTGEDLDTELDEQDQLIEDIKTGLNGKSGSNLNIFAQTTEPDIKKGIWLQTSNEVNNIIQDENVFASEQWNTTKMSQLKESAKWGVPIAAVCVGDYVYMWGKNGGGSSNIGYKYNIETDTYTQIANAPINYSSNIVACAVGTDIHIFGGSTTWARNHYVYNTLTNTYTSKAQCPSPDTSSYVKVAQAATKDTDIYIYVKRENVGFTGYLFRYDSLTNTYTQLQSLAYEADPLEIGMTILDNYIYVCGGYYSNTYKKTTYRYNIATNTYTQLANMPVSLYTHKIIGYGNYIYIFGGYNNATTKSTKNYKYNVVTNSFSELPAIDNNSNLQNGFSLVLVDVSDGKEIYIFGGNSDVKLVRIMSLVPKSYDKDNAIILSQNPDYKYTTELVDSEVINGLQYEFNDVYYYTIQDGLDNTIPTYYGNGISWVKFKN